MPKSMSMQKPIYLMAGGRREGLRTISLVMRAITQDIGRQKPEIAYVGVASGDNWGFYKMISTMIQGACSCHVNRVLIAHKKANLDKARKALLSADAVFMSGGDMEVGMQILKEKNTTGIFQDLYQQGKLFFGVSAGSIMLANEWIRWSDPDDESTAELFPCLGIAPLICDTHAEEDGWVELKAALLLKGDGAVGFGIPSGACIKVHPDGSLEALGGAIIRYGLHKGKVKQQKDLLPADQ
jgi:peptidase E